MQVTNSICRGCAVRPDIAPSNFSLVCGIGTTSCARSRYSTGSGVLHFPNRIRMSVAHRQQAVLYWIKPVESSRQKLLCPTTVSIPRMPRITVKRVFEPQRRESLGASVGLRAAALACLACPVHVYHDCYVRRRQGAARVDWAGVRGLAGGAGLPVLGLGPLRCRRGPALRLHGLRHRRGLPAHLPG